VILITPQPSSSPFGIRLTRPSRLQPIFSPCGDLDATGGGVNVTVSAYDLNDNLIGSDTEVDSGGETWTLSFPGMHSVRFPGTSANPSFGGIALDDVTFNTPGVPEPRSAAILIVAAIPFILGRRRAA
jgi:hypothetical protein